mmetsp:Transcript_38440/g.62281  ORF Transcript_38440/g.62281 Transcript_38440/m.62281 type:complete len:884 (+) Transcript_38440:110-2761(+)|eukprot:CAMPEP_0184357812 /NCGR_PEP_ID=MMETSP1089-20130417/110948_1 /TAXON_ID=38269 ORGANISM="Gloeochaete wittrockiana, Strain SAG46.84" /NCGR_SAMPLE_ID=MMETSP1089 /ASSEMBLY_ACC=CAM_ASM_000445 /LENGTH=883 /DNA_ID=CAMNT_0026695789 /DNA_START=86 /DNA_END=2737 /DNA_ORIENTATION=+
MASHSFDVPRLDIRRKTALNEGDQRSERSDSSLSFAPTTVSDRGNGDIPDRFLDDGWSHGLSARSKEFVMSKLHREYAQHMKKSWTVVAPYVAGQDELLYEKGQLSNRERESAEISAEPEAASKLAKNIPRSRSVRLASGKRSFSRNHFEEEEDEEMIRTPKLPSQSSFQRRMFPPNDLEYLLSLTDPTGLSKSQKSYARAPIVKDPRINHSTGNLPTYNPNQAARLAFTLQMEAMVMDRTKVAVRDERGEEVRVPQPLQQILSRSVFPIGSRSFKRRPPPRTASRILSFKAQPQIDHFEIHSSEDEHHRTEEGDGTPGCNANTNNAQATDTCSSINGSESSIYVAPPMWSDPNLSRLLTEQTVSGTRSMSSLPVTRHVVLDEFQQETAHVAKRRGGRRRSSVISHEGRVKHHQAGPRVVWNDVTAAAHDPTTDRQADETNGTEQSSSEGKAAASAAALKREQKLLEDLSRLVGNNSKPNPIQDPLSQHNPPGESNGVTTSSSSPRASGLSPSTALKKDGASQSTNGRRPSISNNHHHHKGEDPSLKGDLLSSSPKKDDDGDPSLTFKEDDGPVRVHAPTYAHLTGPDDKNSMANIVLSKTSTEVENVPHLFAGGSALIQKLSILSRPSSTDNSPLSSARHLASSTRSTSRRPSLSPVIPDVSVPLLQTTKDNSPSQHRRPSISVNGPVTISPRSSLSPIYSASSPQIGPQANIHRPKEASSSTMSSPSRDSRDHSPRTSSALNTLADCDQLVSPNSNWSVASLESLSDRNSSSRKKSRRPSVTTLELSPPSDNRLASSTSTPSLHSHHSDITNQSSSSLKPSSSAPTLPKVGAALPPASVGMPRLRRRSSLGGGFFAMGNSAAVLLEHTSTQPSALPNLSIS